MPLLHKLTIGIGSVLALAGCSTYDDGYGYGGVSLGYNVVGQYGSSYGGWYNDYYYPGTGYYVYDRRGSRHRWNDAQRRYFEGRRYTLRDREDRRDYRAFRRDGRADNREFRQERRQDRQRVRSDEVTREAFRADRQRDRQTYRAERRDDRRKLRRDLRDDRPRPR